jgi:hypothetical protein
VINFFHGDEVAIIKKKMQKRYESQIFHTKEGTDLKRFQPKWLKVVSKLMNLFAFTFGNLPVFVLNVIGLEKKALPESSLFVTKFKRIQNEKKLCVLMFMLFSFEVNIDKKKY